MKNTNLLIGKINSGKTKYLFNEVDKLIESNENILIVDSKEEYYKTYAQKLIDNNYNTYIFNMKDPSKSNGFNPLSLPYKLYKEGKKDEAVSVINTFAKELFKSEDRIDPFWTNMSADYFVGLTLLLFEKAKEDEINIGSIYMMVSEIESKYIEKFKKYVEQMDMTSAEYITLSGTLFSANETRQSIISVLKSSLNKYVTYEGLLNLISNNEINLSDLNDKFAIFIINNSDYSKLTNIIIDEIASTNNKVTYILDNIDELMSIESLNNILENSKVFIATRNIERMYYNYDKFITDKIENIEEIDNKDKLEVGNYSSYPEFKSNKNKYFKVESIL